MFCILLVYAAFVSLIGRQCQTMMQVPLEKQVMYGGIYLFVSKLFLQCFDAVGWAAGRASGL